MQLKTGTALKGGEFVIEKVLGQGGFGITYLAVQAGLNRKVAVKEFFMSEHCNREGDALQVSVPSLGSRDQVARFKAKFVKEAQTIAMLNHPNIIRIISVFEENGTAYYVMDYVDGGSLEQLSDPSAPMPASLARKYIGQVADALSYLHANNILHLDIKPSNVLVSNSNAVLIDFGISKRYDSEDGGQTSTSPIGISEGYAPLEQYNKEGVSRFTPASDVYSLGATLYRLVTGRRPLGASELVTRQEGLNLPAGLAPEISGAIRAAMCPVIGMRPQTVEQFMDILEGRVQLPQQSDARQTAGDTMIFTGTAPESPQKPKPPVPPAPKSGSVMPRKKKAWGKWIAIIAVVSVIGIGAWWGISTYMEKKHEQELKDKLEWYLNCMIEAIESEDEYRAYDLSWEVDEYYESLSAEDQNLWDVYMEEWFSSNVYEAEVLIDWLSEDDEVDYVDDYDDYDDYDYDDLASQVARYLFE